MEMITTRGDIVRETKTLYTYMLFVCFLGGLFGVQSSKVHGSCCVEKSSLGWSRLDEHVSLPPTHWRRWRLLLSPLDSKYTPPSLHHLANGWTKKREVIQWKVTIKIADNWNQQIVTGGWNPKRPGHWDRWYLNFWFVWPLIVTVNAPFRKLKPKLYGLILTLWI